MDIRLAFSTLACPDWSLDAVMARGKDYGYDGVELRAASDGHLPTDIGEAEGERIRAHFADAELEIAALSGYARLAAPVGRERDGMLAEAHRLIRAARVVGCPRVRMFGGKRAEDDFRGSRRRLMDALVRLAEPAAQAGVTLAVEMHDDWLDALELADCLAEASDKGGHRAGLVWDPVNALAVQRPTDAYAVLRDWIVHVHVKWISPDGAAHRFYALPGEGDPEWLAMSRRMDADGYTGFFSFEWEKKWMPALPDPDIALPKFVEYFRDA